MRRDSSHVVPRGEGEQTGRAGGSDKGDDAGRSELSQVARIPVEDVVVARTPQNGLANETISSSGETPVKTPAPAPRRLLWQIAMPAIPYRRARVDRA